MIRNIKKLRIFRSVKSRKLILFLIDVAIFLVAYLFVVSVAYLSDSTISISINTHAGAALVFLVSLMFFRLFLRVYNNVWRYANTRVYLFMVSADAVSGLAAMAATRVIPGTKLSIWHSITLVSIFSIVSLTSRFVYQQHHRHINTNSGGNKINAAIIGAGATGVMLVDELLFNRNSRYRPVCFVDVNNDKIGNRISGLKVFAEDKSIFITLKAFGVQEVFIALQTIDGKTVERLFAFYTEAGYSVKLYDFPIKESGSADTQKRVLSDIKIEDLLFRDALKINNPETRRFYQNKAVLVTGGGGSIGSELCRQIAKCNPRLLIIFDIYENNAYDVQQELAAKYGDRLDMVVEIGSVRDVERLESVFSYYHPDVIFHAAAHKHVPLMEHSSSEAIKNNVFGTNNTADMAEKFGVKKFIIISTDKAVNPTNIMGATKRMCEMIIQCRKNSKTSFAAVRFGNVLGSNGSVIQLFNKQIQRGGPVTITDKHIIRYFMTISEATQLVMEAGALAKSGELFVLDMGKPVKILHLAENMIRLSGFQPYKDIDIQEVGLRPGEKLYEELLIENKKHIHKTKNNLIFIERDPPLSRHEISAKLKLLQQTMETAKYDISPESVKRVLKQIVPTFLEPEEVNHSTGGAGPQIAEPVFSVRHENVYTSV